MARPDSAPEAGLFRLYYVVRLAGAAAFSLIFAWLAYAWEKPVLWLVVALALVAVVDSVWRLRHPGSAVELSLFLDGSLLFVGIAAVPLLLVSVLLSASWSVGMAVLLLPSRSRRPLLRFTAAWGILDLLLLALQENPWSPEEQATIVALSAGVFTLALAAVVGIARRLTDQRDELLADLATHNETLAGSEEALRRLVRSKDEFVAAVSHELRTPLAAVVGLSAELRDQRIVDETEREELVALLAAQSVEVANIVEDLLVAARAETGSLSIKETPVDLVEVVRSVVEATAVTDPNRRLEVNASLPVMARADGLRVAQIVRNLVTNALRYGGPNVCLSVWSDEAACLLEVADDGPGIPSDEWDAIFHPYHRLTNSTSQPGSVGLGLSVARTLARMMSGDVSYRYAGSRSRFRLTLAAADQSPATANSQRPSTPIPILQPR